MQSSTSSRRAFLTSLLALPALGLPRRARADAGLAQDPQDRMEGAPIGNGQRFVPKPGELFTTPYDNDPFIIGVEGQVRCTCGCAHTVYQCRTVDFSCGYWPQHHADMVEQATAGMTAEEIIQAYVTEHGEEFLMMRPEGFNVVGYVLPGTLIAAAGTLLAMFLYRAHRLAAATSGASDGDAEVDTGLSEDERRLLEDELQDLEV